MSSQQKLYVILETSFVIFFIGYLLLTSCDSCRKFLTCSEIKTSGCFWMQYPGWVPEGCGGLYRYYSSESNGKFFSFRCFMYLCFPFLAKRGRNNFNVIQYIPLNFMILIMLKIWPLYTWEKSSDSVLSDLWSMKMLSSLRTGMRFIWLRYYLPG